MLSNRPALRAPWLGTIVAAILLVSGVALSRRVEPAVRIDAVTLAGATPAIRFLPTSGDRPPIALLAHGLATSKETLFRYCEALAVAGFACYAIDLPGHGESRRSFGHDEGVRAIDAVSRALGSVDVFLRHSMGAYAGAGSFRGGHLNPKLFIAVGARPDFGPRSPSLLLLAGRFDEHVPVSALQEYKGAKLVTSSWSDHFLELYDPALIHAAVEAACAVVGKAVPGSPEAWRWRLLGAVLAVLGGVILGAQLPQLFSSLVPIRGALIALITLAAIAMVGSTWFGVAPVVKRIPSQLVIAGLFVLVFVSLDRVKVPRWSVVALAAAGTLGCVLAQKPFLALIAAGFLVILSAGMAVAWVAAYRGTRRDGDIALAIFSGYLLGQWEWWRLLIRHL